MTAPSTRVRPAFIDQLSEAHYARLCRCVILTGNIHDLFPIGEDAPTSFVTLPAALQTAMSQARYPRGGGTAAFVALTLKADGFRFASEEDLAALDTLSQASSGQGGAAPPSLHSGQVPRPLRQRLATALDRLQSGSGSPLGAIGALSALLRAAADLREHGIAIRPIAAILDHADAIFPAGEVGRLGERDRQVLKSFSDLMRDDAIWADAETAEQRPDLVVLLSPTLGELNPRLLQLPKSIHIEIPLPDEATRRSFIQTRLTAQPATLDYPDAADPMDAFVQDSRGLSVRTLDDLITRSHRLACPLDRRSVVLEVNRELQTKLGNSIKVLYPDHSMDDVVGFHRLKRRLAQLKRRIDHAERAPAGMTVVGPNGSGKTYICEAFAADTQRAVVTLSQIRSQWYGQTDVLAETFESVLSVFGRIVVLVDEAHVAFGSIHDRDTHEVEARLTRHIIQMMDNESNRANVFWALITTRPDLLDPDIVRRGRCSLFVPIFDPEGADAADFVDWTLSRLDRAGIQLAPNDQELLRRSSLSFSAGDFREFIADYIDEKDFNPQLPLAEFLESWTPSAVTLGEQRELQSLLAALRCDWRELLPSRLRDLPNEAIQQRIESLKRTGY